MSNDVVGKLYRDVINTVVDDSRVDFEESGIDEGTLQELKQIWQQRLSGLNVARLPWDIDQQPVAIPANNGDGFYNPNGGDTAIKTEDMAGYGESTNRAALRAAQEIQQFAVQQRVPMQNADQSVREVIRRGGLDDTNLSTPNGGVNSKGGLVLPGGGQITQTDGGADLILSQNDGAGDSESDQINSDLDDSEDELNSGGEEEDDEGGMIMLCLYDKVQRVKNKWKYVLKDGVANINGKDYVFSRGSGESEW
jgi:transcription initiation factor TFIIA large subunit